MHGAEAGPVARYATKSNVFLFWLVKKILINSLMEKHRARACATFIYDFGKLGKKIGHKTATTTHDAEADVPHDSSVVCLRVCFFGCVTHLLFWNSTSPCFVYVFVLFWSWFHKKSNICGARNSLLCQLLIVSQCLRVNFMNHFLFFGNYKMQSSQEHDGKRWQQQPHSSVQPPVVLQEDVETFRSSSLSPFTGLSECWRGKENHVEN